MAGRSSIRLASGDQVQLTKRWQQNPALQYAFVVSSTFNHRTCGREGAPVKVKEAPADSVPAGAEVAAVRSEKEDEVRQEEKSEEDLSKLRQSLAEAEARNLFLSSELAQVKEQLGAALACPVSPKEEDEERSPQQKMQLAAQVEDALKDVAREEGIFSANRELIDDCSKLQEDLEAELKELLGKRREDLLKQKRRFEENALAQKAVEQRVRDMAAIRQSEMKELQQQMQGVVSEIYQHSTSLSQCIQGRDLEMEEVISLSAESPPKRCRVSSKVNGMQTSEFFPATIALG